MSGEWAEEWLRMWQELVALRPPAEELGEVQEVVEAARLAEDVSEKLLREDEARRAISRDKAAGSSDDIDGAAHYAANDAVNDDENDDENAMARGAKWRRAEAAKAEAEDELMAAQRAAQRAAQNLDGVGNESKSGATEKSATKGVSESADDAENVKVREGGASEAEIAEEIAERIADIRAKALRGDTENTQESADGKTAGKLTDRAAEIIAVGDGASRRGADRRMGESAEVANELLSVAGMQWQDESDEEAWVASAVRESGAEMAAGRGEFARVPSVVGVQDGRGNNGGAADERLREVAEKVAEMLAEAIEVYLQVR